MDEDTENRLRSVGRAFRSASVELDLAREAMRREILAARAQGASLAQIGAVLGISRQRVHEHIGRSKPDA
jgi:DNA-directed RNA polymerase specialized sigma24 family protein